MPNYRYPKMDPRTEAQRQTTKTMDLQHQIQLSRNWYCQWRHQKFFCGGASRGQNSILKGQNPKICRKWLILAIFFSDWGGKWGGAESPTGAFAPPPMPPLMLPLGIASVCEAIRLKDDRGLWISLVKWLFSPWIPTEPKGGQHLMGSVGIHGDSSRFTSEIHKPLSSISLIANIDFKTNFYHKHFYFLPLGENYSNSSMNFCKNIYKTFIMFIGYFVSNNKSSSIFPGSKYSLSLI